MLAGDVPLLDDTALKDRFQQFMQLARELLTDFREVEHNFRQLDRRVRERIALWDGAKGALLEEIMGERDAIGDSDQGRSFRAFWDFLMSSRRQEELTELLERVLALPPVADLKPDARTRRVHYDWLEAGEHTQRTVAQLSQQLRRFLDDQAWLENRRIMDILHGIESKALGLARVATAGRGDDHRRDCRGHRAADGAAAVHAGAQTRHCRSRSRCRRRRRRLLALFGQVVVDKARLARHMPGPAARAQITLRELAGGQPLAAGPGGAGGLSAAGGMSANPSGLRAVVDEAGEDLIAGRPGTQAARAGDAGRLGCRGSFS